jgi:hypothetical protein
MWFEKARNEEAGLVCVHAYFPPPTRSKASAWATAELAAARRVSTDGRFSSIARLKAAQYFECRPSVLCSKPPTWFACVRQGCRIEADRSSGIRSPQSHCMFHESAAMRDVMPVTTSQRNLAANLLQMRSIVAIGCPRRVRNYD